MFTNWDIEEYEKELFNTALDCPEVLANIHKGHALNLHADKTDMELLSRMVRENKSEASTFIEIDDYPIISRIGDALANKAPDIANWACSKRNEFSDSREYHQMVLDVNLGYDEPIGFGFKSDLEKYATDTIRIVLQRDNDGENQFGFFVLTAYPDIDKGISTGVKYEANDILGKADELTILEKMKLGAREFSVKTNIETNKFTGEQELAVLAKINNKESYVAFMTEKETKIKSFKENLSQTITKDTLAEECPTLAKAINQIELYREVAILTKEKQARENSLVPKTCKENKETLKLNHKKEQTIE